MSIRQFLYPSEEDLYKLVRFLVGKLSESSGARISSSGDEDSRSCAAKEKLGGIGKTARNEEILNGLNDLKLKTQAFESSSVLGSGEIRVEDDLAERFAEPNSVLGSVEIRVEDSKTHEQDSSPIDISKLERFEGLRKNGFKDQDTSQVNM